MKRFKIKTMVVSLACLSVLSGCGTNEEKTIQTKTTSTSEEKLQIVTTFYPMYEFTKHIVKDKAEVELLIPSNAEPHDWEPSPKDMATIQEADVFVYNSPYFETWISSIQESIDKNSPLFVEASESISLVKKDEGDKHNEEADHPEENHQLDPHVWLSPVLAQKEVQTITNALVKEDPENKDFYESNSQAYIEQLQELDELYRTTLQTASHKVIITQHAAFGYLAKEYGFTQSSITGLSPSEEPSPSQLAELKEYAEEHNIGVIYFEETASPKVAQTLANELGADTELLHTIEGVSKEDQEKGLDYIQIMENNLRALQKSLTKQKGEG